MKRDETLIERFAVGVQHPDVSGFELLELLDLRSEIARGEHNLDEEERKQLEEADQCFLKHARRIYAGIAEVADLAEMRRRAGALPAHWWWYLEELLEAEKLVAEHLLHERRRPYTGAELEKHAVAEEV